MKHIATTLFLLLLLAAGMAKAQRPYQFDMIQTGVNEDLYNICCIDANTVFACGENGVILKSTNGGGWAEKHRRTGCQITELCFANPNVGYAVCDSLAEYEYYHQWFLLKTLDGGETWYKEGETVVSWIESYTCNYNNHVRAEMYLIDADTLIIAVSSDGIYKSTDGGLTVRRLDNDFSINDTRGLFFEDNVGYLVWDDADDSTTPFPGERYAGAAKTEDFGESWLLVEGVSDTTLAMGFARFFDKNHIRLFGEFRRSEYNYNGILETYDGFDTFETKGQEFYLYPMAEQYERAKFTENGWGMYILWSWDMPGVGWDVAYTEDDGLTWTQYPTSSLPSDRLYDIDGTDTTFFISCENGKVLKNLQLTVLGTEENASQEITISPNPSCDEVTISCDELAAVKVFSVLGQCVLEKTVNDNAVTIDIHALKPGLYDVQLINHHGTISIRKLVKQ